MTRQSAEGQQFVRACGAALFAGGVLAATLNLVLTPLLPVDAGSTAVSSSLAFGIRQPLAAVSVANIAANNYYDGPFDQLADKLEAVLGEKENKTVAFRGDNGKSNERWTGHEPAHRLRITTPGLLHAQLDNAPGIARRKGLLPGQRLRR